MLVRATIRTGPGTGCRSPRSDSRSFGFSLVAIPLGVWGLVRTRSGSGRGRGFALAALGVSAAWIVATFALVATSGLLSNIDTLAAADLPESAPAAVASGASDGSGASATPSSTPAAASGTPEASQPTRPLSKPRKIYWEDLKAGMCIKTAPESALDIPVVDCRAVHEDEVITRTVMAGPSKWPGDEVIDVFRRHEVPGSIRDLRRHRIRRLTAGSGLLDRRPGRMARRRQDPRLPGVRPLRPHPHGSTQGHGSMSRLANGRAA